MVDAAVMGGGPRTSVRLHETNDAPSNLWRCRTSSAYTSMGTLPTGNMGLAICVPVEQCRSSTRRSESKRNLFRVGKETAAVAAGHNDDLVVQVTCGEPNEGVNMWSTYLKFSHPRAICLS